MLRRQAPEIDPLYNREMIAAWTCARCGALVSTPEIVHAGSGDQFGSEDVVVHAALDAPEFD
jgi:hypothetical protein